MQLEELKTIVRTILEPLGGRTEGAIAYERPELVVEWSQARAVRLSRIPWLGCAQSLVLLVRDPADLPFGEPGLRSLWGRLSDVAAARLPMRAGPTIALTAVVLAADPLRPEDTAVLERTLRPVPRQRVVPLGIFRVDLERQAFAYALRRGPQGLFLEPELLAEALSRSLRQFVRPIAGEGIL
jgi:hypothetical protein